MEKACFANGCKGEVASSCACGGKTTSSCKKHLMKHISLPNEHTIVSLLVSLPGPQAPECLLKISKALKYLKSIKEVYMNQTNKIINHIEKHTRKLIKTIRDTEKGLQDLFGKVCVGKKVNREQYELTQTLVIPEEMINLNRFDSVSENLNQLYNFKLFEQQDPVFECDLLISPTDQSTGGLFSIDLTTFKSLPLNYAPIIGRGVQATRIDKDSYFFYGGYTNKGYSGDIFILNLERKNYQSYESCSISGWGAAVHKSGNVYIFGGHDSRCFISTCKIFELQTKTWLNIANLPLAMQYPTAAVCNNMIILTGQLSEKAYAYENNEFSAILNLPADSNKMICTGWIVTRYILYESQNSRNDKWAAHQIIWDYPSCFWMPTSFKRNHFIYFINGGSNILWRIDTQLKTLTQIQYT